uniref:PRESAN domain-containing protein n=1 Tax=Strongyloides papillosus TaxID=174720 RepID=A0A0N5C249_STREA
MLFANCNINDASVENSLDGNDGTTKIDAIPIKKGRGRPKNKKETRVDVVPRHEFIPQSNKIDNVQDEEERESPSISMENTTKAVDVTIVGENENNNVNKKLPENTNSENIPPSINNTLFSSEHSQIQTILDNQKLILSNQEIIMEQLERLKSKKFNTDKAVKEVNTGYNIVLKNGIIMPLNQATPKQIWSTMKHVKKQINETQKKPSSYVIEFLTPILNKEKLISLASKPIELSRYIIDQLLSMDQQVQFKFMWKSGRNRGRDQMHHSWNTQIYYILRYYVFCIYDENQKETIRQYVYDNMNSRGLNWKAHRGNMSIPCMRNFLSEAMDEALFSNDNLLEPYPY